MKVLDGHIHMREQIDEYVAFYEQQSKAGIAGGVVLSLPPESFGRKGIPTSTKERVRGVLQCVEGNPELYPVFWINPIGPNAADDVAYAADAGVKGFKVICDTFYPSDPRALSTYQLIADAGLPILFHSGILWDGKASSKYNRPVEFEGLIDIKGLRFSLAHISWPWCDEHIAVYGKFLAAKDCGVEMFVDTTPGTPPIYRREALTKLFTVGYDVENNVFYGSDSAAPGYNGEWVRGWVDRDTEILRDIGVSDETIERVFSKNLERFIGISDEKVSRKPLKPGE